MLPARLFCPYPEGPDSLILPENCYGIQYSLSHTLILKALPQAQFWAQPSKSKEKKVREMTSNPLFLITDLMMPRDRIELPTRGFPGTASEFPNLLKFYRKMKSLNY